MKAGDVFEERYRIVRQLGEGGYAVVWLAEHLKIAQKVAIKILLQPGMDPRFLREGQILARLRSDHTVRILDYGETVDGYAYMISEYVEGETLDEARIHGPIASDDVTEILRQVLSSLAEAHEQGIIHRDIKPANLMQLPDGQIKVLDFGIARVASTLDTEGLTASGIVLGTPRYLAPECLLQPDSVSPAADIYALGLVAYAILTGRDANDGLTSRQIVARHLNPEPYTLPTELAIPEPLQNWVAKATAKSPTDRFHDATEALRALDEIAAEPRAVEPPAAAPAPRPAPGPVADGEHGGRTFELNLGDDQLPTLAKPVRAAAMTNPQLEPRKSRRKSRHRRPSRIGVALLLAIVGVTAALALGLFDSILGEQRPQLSSVPDDPPELIAEYQKGRVAFQEERWFDALEHFQKVKAQPDTNSARDLIRQDYVGRIIANILETAIDAREQASSKNQLEAAAEEPRLLLERFPNHEATIEVIASIEKEMGRSPRKRAKRKIKIEGVVK